MQGLGWRAGLAVVGALFSTGCQEADVEPHFGRLVSAGEHIEIWASPGIEVCGGNVNYLDAFVEKLRAEVGPHPEAEALRRYYVLNDKDWKKFDDAVDCRGAGCTTANQTIYTHGFLPSTHELVHAELFTNGHRLLEEGLAVVYGEEIVGQSATDYDITDALSESWVAPDAYVRAGHFASFLIDRHGVESFIAAKDASHEDDSFSQLSSIFEEELGEPLERLLSDYNEYEVDCEPPGYQALLMECDQAPTQWTDVGEGWMRVEFDLQFGCSDENVLGPYGGRMFVTQAFELQERSEVTIAIVGGGSGDMQATVSRCDGSCSAFEPAIRARTDTFLDIRPNYPVTKYLHPGRYSVRVSRPSELGPADVRILVSRET